MFFDIILCVGYNLLCKFYILYLIMFLEDFETTIKPLDDMANSKDESGLALQETEQKIEQKAGQQTEKINSLKSEVSSKMTQYRWFFDSYPNAFHEDMSQWSVWRSFYESMVSAFSDVSEKKIKWFDRNLWDGNFVEVRENWWQIYLKIKHKWEDWNDRELSISLNNFDLINNDKEDGIQPTISISWDESLLDYLLDNNWNTDASKWKNVEGTWVFVNKVLTMNADTDLFKKVFDSVHEKIIFREIQDFHGYVQHANDKTLEVKTDFLLKKGYENEDVNLEGEDYKEYLDFFIDSLVTNIEASDIEPQDLIVYQTLLSLCILLRNSSNNIQDIKKTLWFEEEDNVWKEKTVQWWEDLIEFLPINETDLEHFIACRDLLKNMCMEKLLEEKKLYISDAIEYQSDPRVSEIIRLLNCLNK